MPFFRLLSLLCVLGKALEASALTIEPGLLACLQDANRQQEAESFIKNVTTLPTPAYFPADQNGQGTFLSSAQVFAAFLDSDPKSSIVNHLDELRFLSQSLVHSSVLAVVSHAEGWSEEKALKVQAIVEKLDIRISMIWLSEERPPASLVKLVKVSKGQNYGKDELLRHAVSHSCRL